MIQTLAIPAGISQGRSFADPGLPPGGRAGELIRGKVIPAKPQTAAHYTAIQKTARRLAVTPLGASGSSIAVAALLP